MFVLVLPSSKITAGSEPWTGSFFAVTIFTFTMIMSLFDSTASSASAATGFSILAKGVPSFAACPPRLTGNGSESSLALFASDDSLPFPVSLGGQAAKDGTPFARIENPVAADAELAVELKSDMIIVNVNMVTAKNEPVQGSEPGVILLEGKTKTYIDKTMDRKKLPAGNYIMSVVSEGKTAIILFTIK